MSHLLYRITIPIMFALLWFWLFGLSVIQKICINHRLYLKYSNLGVLYAKKSIAPQDCMLNNFKNNSTIFLKLLHAAATKNKITLSTLEKTESILIQPYIEQTDFELALIGNFTNLYNFIHTTIISNQSCSIQSLIASAGEGENNRTISIKVRYICLKK